MKKIQLLTELSCYGNPNELEPSEKSLLEQAITAAKSAWAPYSDFHVGASLALADGSVITGSNQENAAYPSGLCAERVALFHAGHALPGVAVKMVAISAYSDTHDTSEPISPCGACLQVMAEYERKQGSLIRILWHGTSGKVHACDGVRNLLPVRFELK